MRKVIFIIIALLTLICSGCQRGDFRASLVIEGQTAQHPGWNVGPDLWLEEGDTVKVSGGLIYIEGLGPKDLAID